MRLSVVVVNWNSREDLGCCLESLGQQTHADLEVIVVDNGSGDGSEAMVRERFPGVLLLETGANLGFAEACNRGITASSGEWVATLNNDTVADPGWAKALVDAAACLPPDVGMLQSVLLFMTDADTINSTGIVLTAGGSGSDRREGETWQRPAPGPSPRFEEIFCPTAGAAAYRRSMLDAIKLREGYFDRRHFMYFEDLDLGWRARLAGHSARLVADSIVWHKYHSSADRQGRAWMVVVSRTNRIRTLLKNASPAFLLRTAPKSAYEAAEAIWHGGWRAGLGLPRAVLESLRQRRSVSALCRASRRALERRWAGADVRRQKPC